MTTMTTLFGLALAPLYAAIAEVESGNGKRAANVYQLEQVYLCDCNSILRMRCLQRGEVFRPLMGSDVLDRRKSEAMMALYWEYYGRVYEMRTGKKVTYQVLARIHNGGPSGWKMSCTMGYWHKVERRLEKALAEGGAE